MGISKDFERGKEGEDLLISLLKKAKISCERNESKEERSYYDVKAKLESSSITCEVKNDLYASKSGNIAIEVYNPKSNKKSGLTITKSDLWVHIVDGNVWVARTADLKGFIETNKPLREVEKAGDGNATILLYKAKDILPKVFKCIDHLSGKDIKKTIQSLTLQG